MGEDALMLTQCLPLRAHFESTVFSQAISLIGTSSIPACIFIPKSQTSFSAGSRRHTELDSLQQNRHRDA